MATKKKQTKTAVPPTPRKLSNVVTLAGHALAILWRHKALFGGIIAIYGLLNIIFVSGLGLSIDVSEARNQFANKALGSLSAYTQLVGATGSAPSEAGGVYQLFLALFVSLALIWALRQVYANQVVRIRDAYYGGMYPLVPFMLLILFLALQMVPLIIGASLYQYVVVMGVAATMTEVVLWFVIAIILALISAYLATSTIMALIIVTLPDMTPRQALKLGKQLVAGRRLTVLRKLLCLPIMLLAVTAIVLLPIIFIVPVVASWLYLLIGPVLMAIGHSYVYTLYRELVDD